MPGLIDVFCEGFGKFKVLGSNNEVINVRNEYHDWFSSRVFENEAAWVIFRLFKACDEAIVGGLKFGCLLGEKFVVL